MEAITRLHRGRDWEQWRRICKRNVIQRWEPYSYGLFDFAIVPFPACLGVSCVHHSCPLWNNGVSDRLGMVQWGASLCMSEWPCLPVWISGSSSGVTCTEKQLGVIRVISTLLIQQIGHLGYICPFRCPSCGSRRGVRYAGWLCLPLCRLCMWVCLSGSVWMSAETQVLSAVFSSPPLPQWLQPRPQGDQSVVPLMCYHCHGNPSLPLAHHATHTEESLAHTHPTSRHTRTRTHT